MPQISWDALFSLAMPGLGQLYQNRRRAAAIHFGVFALIILNPKWWIALPLCSAASSLDGLRHRGDALPKAPFWLYAVVALMGFWVSISLGLSYLWGTYV